MEHGTGSSPERGLIALLSITCASSLLLCAPALASPAATSPAGQDHAMGSQIQQREPVHPGPVSTRDAQVSGIDVSAHQDKVDWRATADQGNRFAYVKSSEGIDYTSPAFHDQYTGAHRAGLIRGAYHFALPDRSSGAEQARYFLDHGGSWASDGRTLPGALDMEYNPYGESCYGQNQDQMRAWINDFSRGYQHHTGRKPVIYTSTRWWNQCVGPAAMKNPLWLARYSDKVGELPPGWETHTIWQHSSKPIDQNRFNGGPGQLEALARG